MFSPPKLTIHFCRTALPLFRCLLLCISSTYKYLEESKNAMIRCVIIQIIHNFCFIYPLIYALTDSLKRMNWIMIPEDNKSPLKLCKLLLPFHLCSKTLIDWLKDSRWIMGPENKKSPLKLCKLLLIAFSPFVKKVDWLT